MQFHEFDEYVVRTPAFSFAELFKDNETIDLDMVVKSFLNNEKFLAAIYWSSPALYEQVEKYLKNTLTGKKASHLLWTLKKYAIRSCSRSTPFGTFAGVSLGRFQNNANNPSCSSVVFRKSRPNRELISALTQRVENSPSSQKCLKFTTNTTIVSTPLHFKYIGLINGEVHINHIDHSEAIDLLYKLLYKQYYTQFEIINLLPQELGSNKEYLDFLNRLADLDFIQSEMTDTRFSANQLKPIIDFLDQCVDDKDIDIFKDIVDQLCSQIKTIDKTPLEYIPLTEIDWVTARLSGVGITDKTLFHIDLKQDGKSESFVSYNILKEIKRALTILDTIEDRPHTESGLEAFKKRFIQIYGTSEVSLMEALDPDGGIGFPVDAAVGTYYRAEIIDDLLGAANAQQQAEEFAPKWLMNLMDHSEETIDLSMVPPQTQKHQNTLPPTFYVVGRVVGDRFLLEYAGGASGRALISRFTPLDVGITHLYKTIEGYEADFYKDIVMAEIIFIPPGKVGNVTLPLNAGKYEICVRGETDSENIKIRIEDLFIRIIDNEILLYSNKLGKRIIPRLSNAHNFNLSDVPIYKFLSMIQHQGKLDLGLKVNDLQSCRNYIPRVIIGKVILYRATWILRSYDINRIIKSDQPLKIVALYLKEHKIPQFVTLCDGDNELFLDTWNSSYLNLLIVESRHHKNLILKECISDPKGIDYVQQVVIPFMNPSSPRMNNYRNEKGESVQLIFNPGSEWIYYKIYCNASFSDQLLIETISPLLTSWSSNGWIQKSFFIRYLDPDYHIRFRVLTRDNQRREYIHSQIQNSLNALMESKNIYKFEISTYEREAVRYGDQYITAIESAFSYDTTLILKLLALEGSKNERTRICIAVKNVDSWLSSFGLSDEEKMLFCKRSMMYFSDEFGSQVKKRISNQYRSFREEVYQIMECCGIMQKWFDKRESLIKKINFGPSNKEALIHMSINRWFPVQQRLYEYTVYVFVSKYYDRKLNERR